MTKLKVWFIEVFNLVRVWIIKGKKNVCFIEKLINLFEIICWPQSGQKRYPKYWWLIFLRPFLTALKNWRTIVLKDLALVDDTIKIFASSLVIIWYNYSREITTIWEINLLLTNYDNTPSPSLFFNTKIICYYWIWVRQLNPTSN